MFSALVSLIDGKDEELRAMAANLLAPIRDSDFGRPERKSPPGGWQQWLDGIAAKAAGYREDYEACGRNRGTEAPVDLYCTV